MSKVASVLRFIFSFYPHQWSYIQNVLEMNVFVILYIIIQNLDIVYNDDKIVINFYM